MKIFPFRLASQKVSAKLRQKIESPVTRRLARATFWAVAGTVVARGLNLVALIIVARIINKTAYGQLGIIQSTLGMFGIFAGFGMGMTATKHIAEFRSVDPEKAGRILSLASLTALVSGALMSLVLFALAPWLAVHTLASPEITPLLKAGSLLLFFTALNSAQVSMLAGYEAFRRIARINLVAGVASFPLIISGALLFKLKGALWGLILSILVNMILSQRAVWDESRSKGIPIAFAGCLREVRVLRDFSLPAVLASALVIPVNWICNSFLVNGPGGYAEMGILNATNQWFSLVCFLPGILGQSSFPILSERIGQLDKASTRKVLGLNIRFSLLAVSVPIIVGSVLSPFLMSLYGKGFRAGWPVLIMTLAAAGLYSIMNPVGILIAASGRMWLGAAMNLGWGIIFVILTRVLIDKGAFGLATARTAAYVVHTLWTFGYAKVYLRRSNKG